MIRILALACSLALCACSSPHYIARVDPPVIHLAVPQAIAQSKDKANPWAR